MGSGKQTRVKLSRERRRMSMKFPVAPESMSVVVLMVLFFPCSKMGKLIEVCKDMARGVVGVGGVGPTVGAGDSGSRGASGAGDEGCSGWGFLGW